MGTPRKDIPFTAIFPFMALAFGLAWGIFALFLLCAAQIEALFGPISGSNPLFILAVYAPAISALVVIISSAGLAAIPRFLSRLLLWRAPWPWYGFLILVIPAIYFLGAMIKGDLWAEGFPFSTPGATLAAIGFMLILGPVEEFGWRGVALPLLQRRMAPLWAGLLLGLIWGAWHLPAFFLSGTPQSAWGFTPFLVGSISVSVILTPLFNRGGGSILLAALFHFQLNNPLFPDAQPYDMYLFAAAAVLVVVLNRETMLHRGSGARAVVPGAV